MAFQSSGITAQHFPRRVADDGVEARGAADLAKLVVEDLRKIQRPVKEAVRGGERARLLEPTREIGTADRGVVPQERVQNGANFGGRRRLAGPEPPRAPEVRGRTPPM